MLRRRGAGSGLTVIGAGFAFALSAFCAKLLADALTKQAWGSLVIVAAIAAFGGAIGTLSEQSALQQRQATQVAPVIFVIELLVPVGLAVTVIGESWSSSPVLIGGCLTLVTIGTIALGRTPTIAQLAASGDLERTERPGPRAPVRLQLAKFPSTNALAGVSLPARSVIPPLSHHVRRRAAPRASSRGGPLQRGRKSR